MAHKRTTAPTAWPVEIDEAKQQCRITHDADDAEIRSLIHRATTYVENWTRRALITQTWQLKMDRWWDERYASVSRFTAYRRGWRRGTGDLGATAPADFCFLDQIPGP